MAQSHNLVGQFVGQYEIREVIGKGGMGTVYRAYQASVKREVAIKVLPELFFEQPGYVERFTREATTAATLEHPHIVAIYDFGMQQNITYIVMRLMSGGMLADRVGTHRSADKPLPSLGESAALLNQLASALDYAHSQNVIHRDVKPGNTLFDNQGNAYLSDFGIAKLSATTGVTGTGMAMGTPEFMAPEQWQDAKSVVPASDQYALAVMAYLLVTGRTPFQGDTPYNLMYKHLNELPTPPSAWRTDVPEALGAVLNRGMAKRPGDRFETVTAFAQAFGRAVAGSEGSSTGIFRAPFGRPPRKPAITPIPKPPTHPTAKPTVTVARNRLPIWIGGIAVLGILAGIIVTSIVLQTGGTPVKPSAIPTVAPIAIAVIMTQVPNTVTLLPVANELPSATPSIASTTIVVLLPQPSNTVTLLPVANELPSATSTITLTAIVILSTQRPDTSIPTKTSIPSATNTPLPSATASFTTTPTRTPTITPSPSPTASFTATPSMTNTPTPTATSSGTATFTATPMPTTTKTPVPTNTPSPSPTADFTATPSKTNTPTPTATSSWTATLTATPMPTATNTPLPTQSATPTATEVPPTLSPVPASNTPSLDPTAIAMLPSLTQTANLSISVSNATQLQRLTTLPKLHGSIGRLLFSSDATFLAFSLFDGTDTTVRLFNISLGQIQTACQVFSVKFSLNGTALALIDSNQALVIADGTTCQTRATFKGASTAVLDVAFSPNGSLMATSHQDDTVRIWTVATGQTLSLYRNSASVNNLVFSPDGALLVGTTSSGIVLTWNVATGKPLSSHPTHIAKMAALAFASNGMFALGGANGIVQLWDVKNGSAGTAFKGHTDTVNSIAFSPDSTLLASGGDDKTVRLWNAATGQEVDRLTLSAGVSNVAFSPDGTLLAVSTSDGSLQLWNIH
ncbi:MAG: protein kinase domain-containing protein [Aggregatilineales bacterium]